MIHGYANGYFGRDSYACRIVEAVGAGWLVTRNTEGRPEFITLRNANDIDNPDDRYHCAGDCEESFREWGFR